MINHLRTLLLGQRGARSFALDAPGEEYVPPLFVPPHLPSWLRAVQMTLFGARPDRVGLNYRVHQLLGCLHASWLSPHVAAFDPRVTYNPESSPSLWSLPAAPVITGSDEYCAIIGELPDAGDGRMKYQVRFSRIDEDCVLVEDLISGMQTHAPVLFPNRLSEPIPLPGTQTHVVLRDAAATWEVLLYARPSQQLPAMLKTLEVLGETYTELFVGDSDILRDAAIATKHPLCRDRLAGYVLAYGWHLDQLWRAT